MTSISIPCTCALLKREQNSIFQAVNCIFVFVTYRDNFLCRSMRKSYQSLIIFYTNLNDYDIFAADLVFVKQKYYYTILVYLCIKTRQRINQKGLTFVPLYTSNLCFRKGNIINIISRSPVRKQYSLVKKK